MDNKGDVLDMSKETGFKVGDVVEIIDAGKEYTSYQSWFDEVGRTDLKQKYIDTNKNNRRYNLNKLYGDVIVKGKRNRNWLIDKDVTLYAIKLPNEDIVLIGEAGIKLKETKPGSYPLKYWELEEGKLYHEESEKYVIFRIQDCMLEFKAKEGTNSFIVDNVNHLRLATYNFKEIKEFPQTGDAYYIIQNSDMYFTKYVVLDLVFNNNEFDNRMIKVGNFFKTKEGAEKAMKETFKVLKANKDY